MSAPDYKRLLVCWDAPNLDMTLASVVGEKPTAAHRPDWAALAAWSVARAGELSEELGVEVVPEVCVFINVPATSVAKLRPWVEGMRRVGVSVFAKPKKADSDIDDDLTAHITTRRDEGNLAAVVIASGDKKAFAPVLEQLVAAGVRSTLAGFSEFTEYPGPAEFLDLESITGLFRKRLPRRNLDNLPAEGGWLPPHTPLVRDRRPVYPSSTV